MSQKWFRTLALLSSGSLVILFLLYRSGSLDRFIYPEQEWQSSPNGGPIGNRSTSDTTIKPKKDSTPVYLYSSKSVIVVEKWSKTPKFPDSLFKPSKLPDSILAPKERPMIHGTKSAIIIDNRKFKRKKRDSTKQKPWD